jgi:uncharacterized protein (TIGR02996 family)
MAAAADLLAAVLADPDSDGPRLLYADWLQEHGHSAGAEFIRVQCALARLTNDDAAWFDLEARERTWLDAHGRFGWFYRRGLIERVYSELRSGAASSYPALLSKLSRATPLQGLQL